MSEMVIDGCKLIQTCWACPEQYDVFNGRGEQIGYLRLRHGCFTAEVPDAGGEQVYSACPMGDGMFEDNERMNFLTAAVGAIKDFYGPHP